MKILSDAEDYMQTLARLLWLRRLPETPDICCCGHRQVEHGSDGLCRAQYAGLPDGCTKWHKPYPGHRSCIARYREMRACAARLQSIQPPSEHSRKA